jgi:hypothetical protein
MANRPLFVTGLYGIQVDGRSAGALPRDPSFMSPPGNYNKEQPPTADGFARASSSSNRSFFERTTLMAAASSEDVDVHP